MNPYDWGNSMTTVINKNDVVIRKGQTKAVDPRTGKTFFVPKWIKEGFDRQKRNNAFLAWDIYFYGKAVKIFGDFCIISDKPEEEEEKDNGRVTYTYTFFPTEEGEMSNFTPSKEDEKSILGIIPGERSDEFAWDGKFYTIEKTLYESAIQHLKKDCRFQQESVLECPKVFIPEANFHLCYSDSPEKGLLELKERGYKIYPSITEETIWPWLKRHLDPTTLEEVEIYLERLRREKKLRLFRSNSNDQDRRDALPVRSSSYYDDLPVGHRLYGHDDYFD